MWIHLNETNLTTDVSFSAAEEHDERFKSPWGVWGLAAETKGSDSWRIQHGQNQIGYRSTGEFDMDLIMRKTLLLYILFNTRYIML